MSKIMKIIDEREKQKKQKTKKNKEPERRKGVVQVRVKM